MKCKALLTVDRILAHHEAGHAVAALALRIPFTDVTLSKVRIPPRSLDLRNPHDIERDAVFTLAGEVAEARIHEDLGHASECDRKHLAKLSIDRYPDEPERRAEWILRMEERADYLVEEHWEMIRRLARYVLVAPVVSRAEVIEFLKWETKHNSHSIVSDQ